jgi:hypothetical protein
LRGSGFCSAAGLKSLSAECGRAGLNRPKTIQARLKIPNLKSQINPNDQNSKFQTCLGHWLLEFEIYLEFGA